MPWNPPRAGVALEAITDQIWNTHYVPAMPRFFLSGDGHADPPFTWAVGGKSQAMTAHFRILAGQNQLCLHVETFQDSVGQDDVPFHLSAAFGNKRVFGWEPPVFKVVDAALRAISTVSSEVLNARPASNKAVHDAVAAVDRSLGVIVTKVGTDIPNNCDRRVINAAATWAPVKKYLDGVYGSGGVLDLVRSRSLVNTRSTQAHTAAMQALSDGLMTLRDSMNPTIAAMIEAKISQYPNHTHLIACGYGHIKSANPLLQNCIRIGNHIGIVDPNTIR
ncbi:MAG TPA: hypothetical protein VJ890_20820 [Vineibacter sp.]|nr:hypothetical protein [Vineibacter sp.]